jgi:Aspartyl protease
LQTQNKYGVLVSEETKDNGSRPSDPMIVTFYAINFISKLCRHIRRCSNSKNITPRKIPKTFIRSAHIEHEVALKVGLKTVDTHAMVEVDALLDSGATGLFINRALVQNNGIRMRKLEHPITVYNIDGTVN